MKRCPFCAEEIQDAAIVCRYCNRDLTQKTAQKQSSSTIGTVVAIAVAGLVGLFVLIGIFGRDRENAAREGALTALQMNDVEATLRGRGLTLPQRIEVNSNGFVVADYEIPNGSLDVLNARGFGEERLLAIREALLDDGFKNFRVNVNGPSPGAGLVRRYGSARYIAIGGKVEWITP